MHSNIGATVEANAETLEELLAQFTDRPGSVVPFIGAGASIPYGMPGWAGFLRYLLDFAAREHTLTSRHFEGISHALDTGRLEEAAQRLYVALGEPKFRVGLQSCFRLNGQPVSGPMRHIVDLADGLIITTNYDRVVESAWQNSLAALGVRRDIHQLLATSPEDLARALRGNGYAVLKIHGDVERPETWVLTADLYAALYNNTVFQRFLARFLSVHVPLFIGCSMTEERLLDAMRINECVGYAILAAPPTEAEQRRLTLRLKDCIRIIWLRREDVFEAGSIYDVLEPLLRWLCVRRRVGRVAWDSDPRPLTSWSEILFDLERKGEFEAGLGWIREHWGEWRSWELAVEYLRFADLAGKPSEWRTYLEKFRSDMRGTATPVTQHALDYFYGRLLGQSGHWPAAVSRHTANRPRPPRADRYQVMSWFEEGQVLFRTEEFEQAQVVFEDVHQLLIGQATHVPCLVDVLKFLGTLQVLDTVYDAPGSDGLWVKGHANPDLALAYSDTALRAATDAQYPDGRAWALCVAAFAKEAKREIEMAAGCYLRALEVVQAGACRAATRFHILLYQSAFFRRIGQLSAAADNLTQILAISPGSERAPDQLRLAEQRLLLAQALADHKGVERHLRAIAETRSISALTLDGSTRLERRLRSLLADSGLVS